MDKKRVYYFLISLVIFSVIITAGVIKTNDWVSSNSVQVKIDSNDIDLQDAINQGLLVGDGVARLSEFTASKPNVGHSFDEIWVSASGQEMTLKDAIARDDLCGTTAQTTTYTSSNIPDPVHLATEIEVDIDGNIKSLQDAINLGEVLYTTKSYSDCSISSDNSEDLYYYDSCDNQGTQKLECGINSLGGSYYCSMESRDDTSGDIYRDDTERGCSENGCFSNTISNKIFDCTGTCIDADCYEGWVNKRRIPKEIGCGPSSIPVEDTCDGNRGDAYTCSTADSKNCTDSAFRSVGCQWLGKYWLVYYRYRTINCFEHIDSGFGTFPPPDDGFGSASFS